LCEFLDLIQSQLHLSLYQIISILFLRICQIYWVYFLRNKWKCNLIPTWHKKVPFKIYKWSMLTSMRCIDKLVIIKELFKKPCLWVLIKGIWNNYIISHLFVANLTFTVHNYVFLLLSLNWPIIFVLLLYLYLYDTLLVIVLNKVIFHGFLAVFAINSGYVTDFE
jgi:hypothetical protein